MLAEELEDSSVMFTEELEDSSEEVYGSPDAYAELEDSSGV